jgi:hypothetical protein
VYIYIWLKAVLSVVPDSILSELVVTENYVSPASAKSTSPTKPLVLSVINTSMNVYNSKNTTPLNTTKNKKRKSNNNERMMQKIEGKPD